MPETLYSARSQLSEPGRFLQDAGRALARSLPIAWPLFVGNVRVRYRRSLLGYLWLLLPAVATTLVCVELQSRRLVAVGASELPYALHVASGIVLWQLFVEALNAPLTHLKASRQIITRSRVPHEALILAGAMEVALNAAARLIVLVPVLWAFGVAPQGAMLAVPMGVLALMLLGLAIGLLLAPWGLLFEDVARALMLFVGLWFFLTPIIYAGPVEGALRWNPVTPLLETTRSWIAGGGAAPGFWGVAAGALVGLGAAWLLYRLARPHVVARLG
jgi:lipopolysaccharide transport system permease protein